jgi:hypothetical protein
LEPLKSNPLAVCAPAALEEVVAVSFLRDLLLSNIWKRPDAWHPVSARGLIRESKKSCPVFQKPFS